MVGLMAAAQRKTMTTYPSRVYWDEVLAALRGSQYPQTRGAMCRLEETEILPGGDEVNVFSYDVLGVINKLAGADFEIHGITDEACDQNGETHVPDIRILDGLKLTEHLTEEDFNNMEKYAASVKFYFEDTPQRWNILVYMNDQMGMSFNRIADEIERLNWND